MIHPSVVGRWLRLSFILCLGIISYWTVAGTQAVSPAASGSQSDTPAAQPSEAESIIAGKGTAERLKREGLTVDFSAGSVGDAERKTLYEGEQLQLNFDIRDEAKGAPLRGLYPGAWVDLSKVWNSTRDKPLDCKKRVSLYLQGSVGMRPLVDLNSYYVLVLNQEPSISVIDPLVGMSGITKLYARVILKKQGADWVISNDQRRLFVTMPEADQLAVVDTETFKVITNVPAGEGPARIELQPDGQYLWVANSSSDISNVTVVDSETLKIVAELPLGKGHHEIAFSSDSRRAFISSRDSGTLTTVDIQRLKKLKALDTGPQPIALSYSPLSQALYVADGKSGVVSVIDPDTQQVIHTLRLKPGLGPMRFTEDGRWGLVLNTLEDLVYVFDASTNQLVHSMPTQDRPYQLGISRAFAYVRSLGSEYVSMINLVELANGRKPPVVKFQAGPNAPGKVADISLADGMMKAPGEAAMLVVSPADNSVYYYMEGMNAPMGNFRNYGHRPRAVTVVDRTLKETAPGVYSAKVNLPEAGTYDVAFVLDSPQILHCFELAVAPDPTRVREDKPALEYLSSELQVPAGETYTLRFQLYRSPSGKPMDELNAVSVLFYLAPGQNRSRVMATHIGEGIYEAQLKLPNPGAYYLYVGAPEEGLKYGQFSFRTLIAVKNKPPLKVSLASEK